MKDDEAKKVLEPGYGYCRIERRNSTAVAFKTFYSTDLNDFQRLLQRLIKRQKLQCEYMIKILDIEPRTTDLTVTVGFEYFPQTLKNLHIRIKKSIFEFLNFASQVLFFWNFLRKNRLYLSNFEFNSIRYDDKTEKYKIIDELETMNFNDTWTIHMNDVELFLASLKTHNNLDHKNVKKVAVTLSIGLIFMALLLDEEIWNCTKRAIINRNAEEYSLYALNFFELPQVQEIMLLSGKELFTSTIMIPNVYTVRPPLFLLQELKHNLTSSLNHHKEIRYVINPSLVKTKSVDVHTRPPSTTDLSNNDTFTMISRHNINQTKSANLQFLMEKASIHDPLELLVSHINGFISEINIAGADPSSLTDVNLLETIKKRNKTGPCESTAANKLGMAENYVFPEGYNERENIFKTSLQKLTQNKYPLQTNGNLKNHDEPFTPAFKSLEEDSSIQNSSLSRQTLPITSFSDKTDHLLDNIKQVGTVNFDLQSADNLLSDLSESVVKKVCFKRMEKDGHSLLESMQMKTKLFDY